MHEKDKNNILNMLYFMVVTAYLFLMVLFSLDSFKGDKPLWQNIAEFAIHLLPAVIFISFVLLRYMNKNLSALLLIVYSIASVIFFSSYNSLISFALVSLAPLATGIMEFFIKKPDQEEKVQSKLVLYSAICLDGNIADINGGVDWIYEGADYGYDEFYSSVDSVLLGSNTYEQILSFGKFPYEDKECYVFSQRDEFKDHDKIQQIENDAADFVKEHKEKTNKMIWLVGGGKLNTTMLEAGLIDEIILFSHPVVLGGGIKLFETEKSFTAEFRLIEVKSFDNGVVKLHYIKKQIVH